MSPVLGLRRFDRLWLRLFQGGSLQVTQVGPKDVIIELRATRLTRYVYFRAEFMGVLKVAAQVVGVRSTYLRVHKHDPATDTFSVFGSWV
jgi:hypothetical protein